MFLLVGCARGARPYVCIGWLWAICFYCACVCVYVCMYVCVCVCVCMCNHMFSLTMESSAGHVTKYDIIVRRSGYLVGSRPIPMEPSTGHMIKYYKYGFTWKLADFICICAYMYAF